MSLLDHFEIEGIGGEVLACALFVLALTVIYVAWLSTGLAPLNYDLFLVEMQTWRERRFVQVLHVGYEEVRQFGGDLIRRVRSLARVPDGETTPRSISDTNVVIQSPATVVEGDPMIVQRDGDMRLWEIEMPLSGEEGEGGLSDSELAAAAAVAVVSGRMTVSAPDHDDVFMSRITEVPLDEQPTTVPVAPRTTLRTVLLPSSNGGHASLSATVSNNPTTVASGHSPSVSVPQPETAPTVTETSQGSVNGVEENEATVSNTVPLSDSGEEPTVPTETPTDSTVDAEKTEEITSCPPLTSVRLKFLDDTQKIVSTCMLRSVGDFKKDHFADAITSGKVVRLIFKGQLLRDDWRTLESYGLHDDCVVHCHISTTPYATSAPPASHPASGLVFDCPLSSPHQHVLSSVIRKRFKYIASRAVPTEEPAAPIGPTLTTLRTATGTSDSIRFPRGRYSVLSQVIFATLASITDTFAGFTNIFGVFFYFLRGFRVVPRGTRPADEAVLNQNTGGPLTRLYRRIHNGIFAAYTDWDHAPGSLDEAADAAARPAAQPLCIGDFVLWIFAVQFAGIWTFVYCFPQVCDRLALSLLVLITLYFVFVVCRHRSNAAGLQQQRQTSGAPTAEVH